ADEVAVDRKDAQHIRWVEAGAVVAHHAEIWIPIERNRAGAGIERIVDQFLDKHLPDLEGLAAGLLGQGRRLEEETPVGALVEDRGGRLRLTALTHTTHAFGGSCRHVLWRVCYAHMIWEERNSDSRARPRRSFAGTHPNDCTIFPLPAPGRSMDCTGFNF